MPLRKGTTLTTNVGKVCVNIQKLAYKSAIAAPPGTWRKPLNRGEHIVPCFCTGFIVWLPCRHTHSGWLVQRSTDMITFIVNSPHSPSFFVESSHTTPATNCIRCCVPSASVFQTSLDVRTSMEATGPPTCCVPSALVFQTSLHVRTSKETAGPPTAHNNAPAT